MTTRITFITLLLCAFAALGCAKINMQSGTDGATHFLAECDGDADCGELSCLCGVCSKSCDGDLQCGGLSAGAECLEESSSCTQAEQSCALECSGDEDCDGLAANARCETGRCVRPAPPVGGDGGQGGSGGSAGAGGSGDRDAGACAAMDAAPDGSECLRTVGFTFDGSECRDIQCGCTGDDCDALFPSLRACEQAYSACVTQRCAQMDARSNGTLCGGIAGYSWNGTTCDEVLCGCAGEDCEEIYASNDECLDAHRACTPLTMCTKPSDCVLSSTNYCSCNEVTLIDAVAISEARQFDFSSRSLAFGQPCPDCEHDPFAAARTRFLPQCVSATQWEGGQCQLLDTELLPCTPEVGCRVRARSCCECGADVSRENLMAIPNGGDAAFNALCEADQACEDCGADYPDSVVALCVDGFCTLMDLAIE
jgi:hypothetical protein